LPLVLTHTDKDELEGLVHKTNSYLANPVDFIYTEELI
jgi:hypothetical protein